MNNTQIEKIIHGAFTLGVKAEREDSLFEKSLADLKKEARNLIQENCVSKDSLEKVTLYKVINYDEPITLTNLEAVECYLSKTQEERGKQE